MSIDLWYLWFFLLFLKKSMKFSSVFPNKGQEFKVTATLQGSCWDDHFANLATGQTCHGIDGENPSDLGFRTFWKSKKEHGSKRFSTKNGSTWIGEDPNIGPHRFGSALELIPRIGFEPIMDASVGTILSPQYMTYPDVHDIILFIQVTLWGWHVLPSYPSSQN